MNEQSLHHHPKPANGSANGFRGNEHRSQPKIDFWVVVDALTHRWPWLVIGALIFGAGFFELGSWYFKPKFTATAQLMRDETSSDFFKQTPMTPETFAGLLRSPELLRRVGTQADPPIPPEKLTKLIKIEPEPDSDLVKVQLSSFDPHEAVDLLNCFLQQSVAFTKEFQKNQATKLSDDYLKKQVAQMESDIKVLQEQFRGAIGSSLQTNQQSQSTTNASTLSPSQLITIQKQRERLDHLFTQLNELLAKYTEKHPSVQATREQIEDLQMQLASLPPGVTNSPTLAAQVANSLSRSSPDSPNAESQIFQIRLLSLEEAQTQLKSRQREAELYASTPPGLAHVFAEASMKTVQAGLRGVKIGIASVFGGFVGIGAGLVLILLLEVVDRRLRTTEDLARVTKLPLLTTLGNLEKMETAERTQWAFRTWTMLQGRLSRSANHGLVCGITSSEAGEGRSTWINLLAEAASMTGFRVLTIATKPSPTHLDSDEDPTGLLTDQYQMDEPTEPNSFSSEANGFDNSNHSTNGNGNGAHALATNVLTSPAKVTEQLTGPNSQPVVHIPLPGWVWNLQRRKQWREALNHWRNIDNLVILVELPPASVAEAVLLGSNLPNLVWLADSGKADAGETRTQLQTLRDARCNLVGAVLNREHSVPLRKRFPRWIGCSIVASAAAISAAPAQNSAILPNDAVGAKSPPIELAVAQPTNSPPKFSELPEPTPEPALALQTNFAFSVISPAQRATWQQHLTLGPGDVLNLGLYGAPELTRAEVSIGPDGRVSYLEAQDVRAEGLTIDELRAALDKELANFRRAPRTMITPVAFRSKRYYILGKIMTKGVYTLDRPMTVLEAIARAHGLENGLVDRNVVDLADFQKSFLARGGKRYPLNFERLFQEGDLSQNVPVEPGDYIYFPSTDIKEVYVVGEIRLPGAVTYSADTTIMAAITARGGYSDRAYKSRVLVVRGSLNNPQAIAVNTHAILDGKEQDFRLQPRDIIYVNSRPFIKVEELADLAVTAFIQSLITSWVGIDLVRPFSQNPVLR